ncbi:MAG: zinc ribbon domain-containing protein [Candidatus Protistobacter heckmanni]|nr:zinc ribbon domain-containing protein [Candidatus Protistobacter heckmanni]
MPIYAYRCASCDFAKDVLQKMSDAPLTQCPSCGQSTFAKQVTAAGFQLKGSGWYATDFRGGSSNTSATAEDSSSGASDKAPAKTESAAPAVAPASTASTTAGK